jgi:YHS domain-containing protein
MKQWVKGNPTIQAVFDGHTYHFANEQGKQMFSNNLAKYVPVLGGDCGVSLVKMGKRVPGNIRQTALNNGRLFLFASEDGKKMFLANPQAYVNADLAYGGNCVVCKRDMKQTVPGKTQFTLIHKGMRYLFPSTDQRDEFLKNPAKYEVAATKRSTPTSGSRSRQPARSGSSSR